MSAPAALDRRPRLRQALDWPEFVAQDWDRRPVLFKGVAEAGPFALDEVFRSALAAAARSRRRLPGEPDNTVLTLGRLQQLDPAPWMPQRADKSMDGYRERMLGALGECRYALVISAFHSYRWPLWRSERAFFAPLWREAGLPVTGAITTLFHGNYESTPVGVHRDRFATFMVPVQGRKRMRFWTEKPWREAISTLPDYRAHLDSSFLVEAEPGDVLYWPADYYHVGESVDGGVSTSVNLGVPRHEHRPVYELEDLMVDIGRADAQIDPAAQLLRASLPAGLAALTPVRASADGVLADALPPALAAALAEVRAMARPAALHVRMRAVALQRWSAGGFEPPPARERARAFAADARVALVETVLRRRERGGWRFAAHGHGCYVRGEAAAERSLLARLQAGAPVAVAELLRGRAGERRAAAALLDWLDSCRVLRRLRG